jgi:hypothetical protein
LFAEPKNFTKWNKKRWFSWSSDTWLIFEHIAHYKFEVASGISNWISLGWGTRELKKNRNAYQIQKKEVSHKPLKQMWIKRKAKSLKTIIISSLVWIVKV